MMRSIELRYGRSRIPFEYDDSRFEILGAGESAKPLTDGEIGGLFDKPWDSGHIEEIVTPGESVLVVVPDATRDVGTGQIINLLSRRLIAAGTMPYDISIIFATGLHRPVTAKERLSILTPFIEQRLKTFDHNPNDLSGFLNLGETEAGIPIELNRKLVESDHVFLIGGVGFHYFAGFTGGRKLVCPGLASKRTIVGTHGLAFDRERLSRAAGVGSGLLTGNPVHEAFIEVVRNTAPAFAINTLVDDQGRVTDLVCGNWETAHVEACRRHAEKYVISIPEKRDLVIVSCGGSPYDINMIQSHKAVETAAQACTKGGTIIVLAECPDGGGSEEFSKSFGYGNSSSLAQRLAERYSVGAQTAWNLLRRSEQFEIHIVTKIDAESTTKMGLRKSADFASALSASKSGKSGYIIPYGAKFLPSVQ